MKTLKAALIGTGYIAETAHIPALRRCPGVELTALCSRHAEKAQRMAEKFGIEHVYTDPETMLREIAPELVCICTPNASHPALTALCLEHGANVLCEKPVALSVQELARLFALAQEKGLRLMAAQTMRYQPGWQEAKRAVESGLLGTVYAADVQWVRPRGIPTWGSFHKKEENVGGVMADLGVHGLDALVWLTGSRITEISGAMGAPLVRSLPADAWDTSRGGSFRPGDFDVEEFAMGTATLDSGAACSFRFTWAVNDAPRKTLQLFGTGASLSVPDLTVYPAQAEPYRLPKAETDSHRLLIGAFVQALTTGGALPVQAEETLNVTRALEEFYRTARWLPE